MISKAQILERMALYRVNGGGIGSWLTEDTSDAVFDRLGRIDSEALPAVQLNQLLVLSHEAPVSDGFYRYYWLETPKLHPYCVRLSNEFRIDWEGSRAITSLEHLAWGLHRLYIDGLLYFGNIRTAFRTLREFSFRELQEYFSAKRIDTGAIRRRGPPLPLVQIDKQQRYLISEMACKSYGPNPQITSDLRSALHGALAAYGDRHEEMATISLLLESFLPQEFAPQKGQLIFSASEILDRQVRTKGDIDECYRSVAKRFEEARGSALENTKYYLSMLADLDVYVATSMRDPDHFLRMAQTCESVFSDARLRGMNLRYFDPTLSAANGHEDKGLIECLMVKCAKALVYCGGEKESYGKDAEAAMALSLGRPVIFYCEQRAQFYREVHPLTRLIEFETGVAVGAMVTDNIEEVAELLARIFENRMSYKLTRSISGSLRLNEEVTGSVVRLQTSDKLLSETFWNHYHQEHSRRPESSAEVDEGRRGVVSPIRREGKESPRSQESLGLEDTSSAIPLAARNAVKDEAQVSVGASSISVVPKRSNIRFPMTDGEIFDGISKVRSSQPSGGRRFATFSEWMRAERVEISEVIRLLRFVEATLGAHSARSSYVYKYSDLTRWYGEMCAGEEIGSWR